MRNTGANGGINKERTLASTHRQLLTTETQVYKERRQENSQRQEVEPKHVRRDQQNKAGNN